MTVAVTIGVIAIEMISVKRIGSVMIETIASEMATVALTRQMIVPQIHAANMSAARIHACMISYGRAAAKMVRAARGML